MRLIVAVEIPDMSLEDFHRDEVHWISGKNVFIDGTYFSRHADGDGFIGLEFIEARP